MTDTSRSRFQFTTRTLLFIALCLAGLLAGYRVGHQQGYLTGMQKRQSEGPVTIVYDIADVVSCLVLDEDSGRWRSAHPDERTQATADFDSLVGLITDTVYPETWGDVGGPGAINVNPETFSLVVRQHASVHEEIQTLLQSLPDGRDILMPPQGAQDQLLLPEQNTPTSRGERVRRKRKKA